MNPMTNIKNTQKISDREIELGTAGTKNSWHNRYKDSAWIFIGGLPYDLTEGDVICVFSQCGEIVNCNMVRDQKTAKSKGFMFLCYEDQRSTILAVDNLNGIKILNRTIRVDHVLDYKPPKDHDNDHEMTKLLKSEGCAPKVESESEEDDVLELDPLQDMKHQKKKKKKEKKEKKHKKDSRSCSPSDDRRKRVKQEVVVKEEKVDPGYRDTDGYHGNKRRNERPHGDRYEGSDNETKSRRSDYEDGHRDQSDISHRDGSRDNRDGNRDNRDGNRDNRDGNRDNRDGNRDNRDGNRDNRDGNRDNRDCNPRDGNRAQRDGNPRDGHRNVRSRRSRERTPPVRRRSPSRRDRSRSRSRSPPRRDRSRSPPRRSRSRSPQRRGRSTDLRNKRR